MAFMYWYMGHTFHEHILRIFHNGWMDCRDVFHAVLCLYCCVRGTWVWSVLAYNRDKYNGWILDICCPYNYGECQTIIKFGQTQCPGNESNKARKGYGSLICLWLAQLIKATTWLLGDDTFLQPKGVTMHALGQLQTFTATMYSKPW